MFFTPEQQETFDKFKSGETRFSLDRISRSWIIDGILIIDDEHTSFSRYFMINNVLYEVNTEDYTKENFHIQSFHNEIKINQIIFIAIVIYDEKFSEFNIKEKLDGKIINNQIVSECYFNSL